MIAMKAHNIPIENILKVLQFSCFEVCPKMSIRLSKNASKKAYGKHSTGQIFLLNISCSFLYHFMIKALILVYNLI